MKTTSGPQIEVIKDFNGVEKFIIEGKNGRFTGRCDAYASADEFASAVLAGEFKISTFKTGDGRPVYTRQATRIATGVFLGTEKLQAQKGATNLYDFDVEELDGV